MKRVLSLVAALVMTGAGLAPAMVVTTEHPGSLPILLGVENVRKELKLTSLQKAVLNSLRSEYKTAARALTNPMPTTPTERAAAEAKLQALNQRYNARALSALNDSQRQELLVIEKKVLGALTVFQPKVQKQLALTPAQVTKVEQIRQKGLMQVAKVNRKFEEGRIDYQERLAELRKFKGAQSAELLRVLTPEQKTALAASTKA